jgi:hypothetical protein
VLTRHVSRQLARYCDGQLPAGEARAVEAHLATCPRCQTECDEIRFAAGVMRQLKRVTAPASIWSGITAQLDARPEGPAGRVAPFWISPRPIFGVAVLLLAIGIGVYWSARPSSARPWEVARLNDGVRTNLAAGDWVETDAGSRARITVGAIGTVDVEPGTRVRLGALLPDEYRLALAQGTISARISAPPRLFFVDTPASTVVDLGCAYTVQVDEAGTGDLRVTEGWASLEWKGRESLVPAGAHCRIRPGVGPGTPFFEDASAALQEAVASLDFGGGGSAALTTVLAESRVRDTLTLWHLLSRVPPAERVRVYDRIAELTPVPQGVVRELALQLEPDTLRHWREELAWTW